MRIDSTLKTLVNGEFFQNGSRNEETKLFFADKEARDTDDYSD